MKNFFAFASCWLATRSQAQSQKEDCPDCSLEPKDDLVDSLTCETVVEQDQVMVVHKPAVLYSEVAADCPESENGPIFYNMCEDCAALHMPCQSQFVACKGCCPWNEDNTNGDPIPLNHQCEQIKSYFRYANHATCKLKKSDTSATNDVGAEDAKAKIVFDTVEPIFAKSFEQECKVGVEQVMCDKHPILIDFECTQCNQGSSGLLKQCCDAGVEFSKSKDLQNVPGIEPFVVLIGCDIEELTYEYNGISKTAPWNHRDDYAAYTEEAQLIAMDAWVEKNVCELFPPTDESCCARSSSSPCSRRRDSPRWLSEVESVEEMSDHCDEPLPTSGDRVKRARTSASGSGGGGFDSDPSNVDSAMAVSGLPIWLLFLLSHRL